ncbi:type II toxin-antitoxin system RelE/ParE family toxin [Sphingosinicella terrae]|jgi:toxin ParE1/3/4|uniref:type II toxin-antitoxin system RelE/ParE family toxin n=1 Tax=Sphingosinicella terrae TaxID=2172047 RepID=UPI000E0D6EE4|nr:type II toxin-antitoxin system RelE/ParE family toxin [Sphingosinicella terrae]
MRIEWSPLALRDREAIFDHIMKADPIAAAGVDERISLAVRRLSDFPESGRPGRVEGTGEIPVSGAPYVMPYRILEDVVRILRVIHAARLWPDDLEA